MGYKKLMVCILYAVACNCAIACEITRNNCHNDAENCTEVKVNCSGRHLNQIPMTIPRETTDLNLANNNLNESSFDRLKYFKKLVKLNLGGNQITKLFPGAFKGLRHLKELDLRHNPLWLSEICFPEKSFADLVSLEKLNIIGVTRRPEDDQTASVYPIRSLLGLPSIKHLDLSGGGSNVTFPEEITRLKTLESLQFFHGNIPTFNSKTVHNLQYTNIKTLSVKDTHTKHIEDGVFSNFTRLRRLGFALNSPDLTCNGALNALATTLHSGIDTLLLEDLSSDLTLKEDIFCNEFMSKMKTLSIRGNGFILGTLTINISKCLSNIEYLSVGYNNLYITLDPGVNNKIEALIFSPPKLKVLDLSCLFCTKDAYRVKYRNEDMHFDENFYRISEIPTDKSNVSITSTIRPSNIQTVYMPASLQYAFVNDMALFLGIIEDKPKYVLDNNLIFLNASGLKWMKSLDQPWLGLSRLQIFDLSYWGVSDVTDNAFIDFPSLKYLNLSNNELGNSRKHCQNAFDRLYNLADLDLSTNGIENLDELVFVNLTKLHSLKLNNNLLKHLQFSIKYLASLKLLDISYNRFQTLGKQEIENLEHLYQETSFTLDVTRNPLLCNCESLPFITWIQTTLVSVYDRESLTCNHDGQMKRLMDISVSDLRYKCSYKQRIITISSTLSSLVFLLAGVTILVIFKYRWQILWYYYSIKLWLRKPKPRQEDIPLLANVEDVENYDLYVVYSGEHDYQFVTRDLRRVIEEDWNKKMFIWERDALAGGTKQDDIVFYQEKSNKILVYLTPHFIEDKWSLFDFHMASTRAPNKILIIYSVGTGLDTMPVSVRKILSPGSGYNVVEWSDNEYVQNCFWRRLKRFLDDSIE